MKNIAYRNNTLLKIEYDFRNPEWQQIIDLVPIDKLKENDKVSLVSENGDIVSVYFWGDFDKFSDLDLLHPNVRLVCLKYNKVTGVHYYKYSIPNNPLEIDIPNIVATSVLSNNPDIVTVYTIDSLHADEEKNIHFFSYDNFTGITLNINNGEILDEIFYDTQTHK